MPQPELLIAIAPNGDVRFIYSDQFAGFLEEGEAETKRVSHVEPCTGGWAADMSPVGGPTLGPFKLRQEALDAEMEWLAEHLF